MTDAETVTEPGVEDALADDRPAALLRGGAKGLEIFVRGTATVDAIAAAIEAKLAEAPGFFRGSQVRVRVEDGPMPAGCLARIDAIAATYGLAIVEVGAAKPAVPAAAVAAAAAVPVPAVPEVVGVVEAPSLAAGSVPVEPDAEAAAETGSVAETVSAAETETETGGVPDAVAVVGSDSVSIPISVPVPVPVPAGDPELDDDGIATKAIVGPVRSGVVLEHDGHIVIFGDVNPGAEVRASGNIVVLGRLRGTAHAAIGRDVGFIVSLRLEPQQLRIGRQLARAADKEKAGAHPEIAHIAGGNIIVERYHGRLPGSLSTSV